MKSINVAAAVIRDDNGRIFATMRGYGNYKGWWEFPGGKIEPGETPEEAVVREIVEELDSRIEITGYLGDVEYDYPEFHLCMKCYWAKLVSGSLTLKEHADAAWLTKDDLYSVKWLPADFPVLEKISESMG